MIKKIITWFKKIFSKKMHNIDKKNEQEHNKTEKNENNNKTTNIISKEMHFKNNEKSLNLTNWRTNNKIQDFFNGVNKIKLPNRSGVYIFWEQNKCIYVGQSDNIKRRISEYLSGRNKELFNYLKTHMHKMHLEFVFINQSNSDIEINQKENELITRHKPFINKKVGGDHTTNTNLIKLVEYDGRGKLTILKSFNDLKKDKVGISGIFKYKGKKIDRENIIKNLNLLGIDIKSKRYSKDAKYWILGINGSIGEKKQSMIDEDDLVILHDNFVDIYKAKY